MGVKTYIGDELELFSHAVNRKRYYATRITPRLGDRVLEVGAGLAGTTRWLCTGTHQCWLCLEPDSVLHEKVQSKVSTGILPDCCSARNGTIDSLKPNGPGFDSILYIDVLEHIAADRDELRRAGRLPRPNGEIIILSFAHNYLFSLFDRQIGHQRRYDRQSARQVCPPELSIVYMEYLDSVGMFASLANRWLLRQSVPTVKQILFWDRIMVRISMFCDPLFLHMVGKSILVVMRRNEGAPGC